MLILEPDAILCSDGHRSYQAFARISRIIHRPVNLAAGIRVADKAFHIQHENAYNSRLKGWMPRFHGIATNYLGHYFGWRQWLDTHLKTMSAQEFLTEVTGANRRYQQLMQT